MKPIRNSRIPSPFQTPQYPRPGPSDKMCPWPQTLKSLHELSFCCRFQVFYVPSAEASEFLHCFEEVALGGEEGIVAFVVDESMGEGCFNCVSRRRDYTGTGFFREGGYLS